MQISLVEPEINEPLTVNGEKWFSIWILVNQKSDEVIWFKLYDAGVV
jgi:hypothetical protein